VGCDRLCLALLCDAYEEEVTKDDAGKEDVRVVLRLRPFLAPVEVALLPLSKKPDLQELAQKIRDDLADETKWNLRADYDETGSIGKRYRRQDEIGTPLCVTVDFESLEDKKVTV